MKSYKKFDRFADFMRKLIRSRGLTQGQFAERIGVNKSIVSLWVNAKREPSENEFHRILSIELSDRERYALTDICYEDNVGVDLPDILKPIQKMTGGWGEVFGYRRCASDDNPQEQS